MIRQQPAATSIIAAVLVVLAAQSVSCAQGPGIEEPAHGESILDRTEHVEPTLLTQIPASFRWCGRIEGLQKSRIDAGGAELYVEVEGNGMPLVLINGGPGGTHHYFHPWFSRARTFAKIVYYDQRGCGLSDFKPGEEGYSVEQAVGDLDAVRQALGIEKWVVLGYSYGGFLAQLYTVLHPEHVSGLILLGASPGMKADTGQSREGEFITKAEQNRMSEIRKELNAYSDANALSRQKHIELLLYNILLNGDWKRQNFYRPSPDRLAQFALYDVERYTDALGVFERIVAKFGDDPRIKAFGLIWQGHMLDLLGRRTEAVFRYRQAAGLNVTDSMMHGQYGMKYELSPYARERLTVPFTRRENASID